MAIIQTYLYPNIVPVQIWDPTIFSTRNRQVYARPVVIYQGIDNKLQIRVRNQDQVAVNMAGRLIQVDIQNPRTQSTEYSFSTSYANRTRGYANLIIPAAVANSLNERQYQLTCRVINEADNSEEALYIDDNYGVPLDLIVKPAYYDTMPPQEDEADDFLTIDGGTTP